MNYLLVFFVIALVLSPLAWLKTSPAQARATAFRKRAMALGLKVQLVPDPDADKDEKRPSAVRYCLQVPGGPVQFEWTLLRDHRRGWESPWPRWSWFRGQATEQEYPAIADLLDAAPEQVYALRRDAQGISAYLKEDGDVACVEGVSGALQAYCASVSGLSSPLRAGGALSALQKNSP